MENTAQPSQNTFCEDEPSVKHCFTKRPMIIIPVYDINTKDNNYKPLIILTKEDQIYLNVWREKARKLYKKHNGFFSEADEKYLIDPDPFECKWFIFRVKPKSRRATPAPSPSMSVISLNDSKYSGTLNQDLLVKFTLTA
jgi:hypothetical protein